MQAWEDLATLNINGFSRIPKKEFVKTYQIANSSKTRLQWLLLSDVIHTLIYVSALEFSFEDGLIIPGFWVRIPEGPPEFTEGQTLSLAFFFKTLVRWPRSGQL